MSSSCRASKQFSPYTLATSRQKPPQMFTILLSSVVIAGGTYFLYQYLFGEKDDEEHYENEMPHNNDIEEEAEDDSTGYKLRIFFGSQSGTAEGFAFDMEKEAKKFGFGAKAIDLEDFDPEDVGSESLVIFLVATYGEGEPTDNAQEFYNWLSSESDRSDDELPNLEYAVFGLGNSQYEFFNSMGKQFDKLLDQYGATRIFELGLGDDDIGSIEDQFGEWKDALYPFLCSKYLGIDDMIDDNSFETSLQVDILTESDANYAIAANVKLPYNLTNYKGDNEMTGERIDKSLFVPSRNKPYFGRIGICKVVNKYELRQHTKDGSTLHIDFNLSSDAEHKCDNPIIGYHTADNMGFIPRNNHKMVDKFCQRLQLNKKSVIQIQPKDGGDGSSTNYTFPSIVSIENLFLWFLDINGAPNKKLLTILANNFTGDQEEKEEILSLCDNLQQNVTTKHWNICDIFERYKSIALDIESLIELLKPLQPRLYTISSSSMLNADQVSICIKLEQEELLSDEKEDNEYKFNGVQSRYFLQSKIGNLFQFYIEESKFRLPSHQIPVIMISVGAGLAPFAAFIDEGDAQIQAQNKTNKKDYGQWWLFFGCRYKNGDYIYKKKLEQSYKDKDGVIDELKVAFSREQEKKVYVQHLVEESQEELWQLIHAKRAKIYVCGGVAMGKAVRETFTKIFTFYHKDKDGHKYLDTMLKKDQYVQELWG